MFEMSETIPTSKELDITVELMDGVSVFLNSNQKSYVTIYG